MVGGEGKRKPGGVGKTEKKGKKKEAHRKLSLDAPP